MLAMVKSQFNSNSKMSLVNQSVLSTVLVLVAIVCCTFNGFVEGRDAEAMAKCGQLHNGTIGTGSFYDDDYCLLECQVSNGSAIQHHLNEGLRCPSAASNSLICKNGECTYVELYGSKIRLNIYQASYSDPIDSFATACLIKSNEEIQLPIRNRSACVTDCVANMRRDTAQPFWDLDCGSFHEEASSTDTKVIVEVWNSVDHQNRGAEYYGGAVVDVPELRLHYWELQYFKSELVGGTAVNGTITISVEWQAPF